MMICVDFDGVVVDESTAYDDLLTPLRFIDGAREGLQALKRAGHVLVLSSGRANLALREDWRLDPIRVAAVSRSPHLAEQYERDYTLNNARYQQMLNFVNMELAEIFTYIDDGRQGKILADVYVDNRARRCEGQTGWRRIAFLYGEPDSAKLRP